MLLLSQLLYPQTEALKYVGIVEHGVNRGKEIEKWQKNVHISVGSPYCAAFVSWVLDEYNISPPNIRSGLANKFITKASIDAKDVYKGRVKLKGKYLVIWRKGDTWRGHIGFVLKWFQVSGYTIEANTKYKGREGVFIRYRSIKPYSYFRIVKFTEYKCNERSYRLPQVW